MRLALLLGLTMAAFGQSGVVTVTSSVTATAGSSPSLSCVVTAPALPAVHIVCTLGTATILTTDATPPVGTTNGFSGTISSGANSVTWILQQLTAGNVTWQITANTATKAGVFQ